MNRIFSNLAFGAAFLSPGLCLAQAMVGQPAPAFTATDTAGRTQAVSGRRANRSIGPVSAGGGRRG